MRSGFSNPEARAGTAAPRVGLLRLDLRVADRLLPLRGLDLVALGQRLRRAGLDGEAVGRELVLDFLAALAAALMAWLSLAITSFMVAVGQGEPAMMPVRSVETL